MSIQACAALVARGDPARFRTVMLAPRDRRPALLAVYAFNLEVARALWVTSEPMLAEMRLQWWADAVEEVFSASPPRRHEVVTPLAAAIGGAGLPRAPFDALIAARRADIHGDPTRDLSQLEGFVAGTAGSLMALAAGCLAPGAAAEPAIGRFGTGVGMEAWLAAAPALAEAGRGLRLAAPADAASLAERGLLALSEARAARARVPRAALPVMLLGATSAGRLARRAAGLPVGEAPLRDRAVLLTRWATGRW